MTMTSRRRIRVLQVVSMPARFLFFEWLARDLDREAFDLSYLFLGTCPPATARRLEGLGVRAEVMPYPGRRRLPTAIRALARRLREGRPDIVHAHFMDACLAGLTAARLAGIPIRVHSRHHAGPYPIDHRPFWGRWYDRWNNGNSTAIVAPSEQARHALLRHDRAPSGKVVLIPHGFDLDAFREPPEADVRRMREKYALGDDGPVVGVVARYERIKGVEHIIPAFGSLLTTYPSARLVLANARGRRKDLIRRLIGSLPEGRVTEIPFEDEMPALYRTFDVFVHAPIHPRLEAFGQVYVEAMAAGVPCVCTLSGIAGEVLVDGENAVVVGPEDPGMIHRGLLRVLDDRPFRDRLTANARRDVEGRFAIGRMVRSLEDLYIRLSETRGGSRS